MRFNINIGAVASALLALICFQNVNPAYAHASRSPQIVTLNVKSFGATGDGVTDDTAAMQNAANAALATHEVLNFPPGTYLHAGIVSFNSIAVTGSGAASVLLAADPNNSAVLLTGSNPSIQNITLSTVGLSLATPGPSTSTLLVQNANSFTVSNDTIVQGLGRLGVDVVSSSVGLVNACIFDGTGATSDTGVQLGQSHNVSVTNSLFQNEGVGIFVSPVLPTCQSIALLSNTIGNVTYPTIAFGIDAEGASGLDIAQNTVQMANFGGIAIWARNDDSFNVSNNNTWGADVGIKAEIAGPSGNLVNQNVVHNCASAGIVAANIATSAVQIVGNQFGECGMTDTGSLVPANAVIFIYGDSASGANTFVQNNTYQGHMNGLNYLVTCEFATPPHIPAGNVTGNTATQVSLPNSI